MLRARVARLDCSGETRVRMPRSIGDRYSGERALWRKRKSESTKTVVMITASRTFCRWPVGSIVSVPRLDRPPPALLQGDFLEQGELVERAPGAEHHRALGRVGDHDRQPRL